MTNTTTSAATIAELSTAELERLGIRYDARVNEYIFPGGVRVSAELLTIFGVDPTQLHLIAHILKEQWQRTLRKSFPKVLADEVQKAREEERAKAQKAFYTILDPMEYEQAPRVFGSSGAYNTVLGTPLNPYIGTTTATTAPMPMPGSHNGHIRVGKIIDAFRKWAYGD